MAKYDRLFAVPGAPGVIDFVRDDDDRTLIEGETLAEIQIRYPGAKLYTWADWQAEAGARQDTPIAWAVVTAEQFDEMLNVLPPIAWDGGSFLVGEACDHSITTGRARYQGYRRRGDAYEATSRPVTVAEFTALREAR